MTLIDAVTFEEVVQQIKNSSDEKIMDVILKNIEDKKEQNNKDGKDDQNDRIRDLDDEFEKE